MGSIIKLLLGREAGVLAKVLSPDNQRAAELAERARRAGQWCASTPGSVNAPSSRLTAYVLGMS